MPGSRKCSAGCNCQKHTPRTRSKEHNRKISEALTGKKRGPLAEETKAKISAAHTGTKKPESMRQRMSALMRERWQDPEYRQWQSDRHRGRRLDMSPAAGFVEWKTGHIMLTGQQDHPLAGSTGRVFEHRKVLYDSIGPGPHPCHWHPQSDCGKTSLGWDEIHVDHLNDVPNDNRLENLVVSCMRCNWGRTIANWFNEIGER